MLQAGLVVALAFGLAAFTYLRLERVGRRALVPLLARGVAWAALGLLLLDLSCPVTGPTRRPLVLLDGSLSMTAAGGRWAEARDSARRWGEVRRFGDEGRRQQRASADTGATLGRSLLAPALVAASATDRPILVVTDGEVEDAPDLSPDLLARAGVRVFPRAAPHDLAITRVAGPARITAGDSIVLDIDVQATGDSQAPGDSAPSSVPVVVRSGQLRLGGGTVRLGRGRAGSLRLALPSRRLRAGDHLLLVTLDGNSDAEPRTDQRLHLVTVTPTPGVVLVAAPGDWDSRFLYATLRDVAGLPVRGYVELAADRWRSMRDLSLVPTAEVRRAVRRADLLVVKGDAIRLASTSGARGIWRWPSGEGGEATSPGDWYLSAEGSSPVADAFLGQPVDSFPPAAQLTPIVPDSAAWVALTARLGRRGPARSAVFGRDEGRVRRVVVAVDGLWRWVFRGGSSEQTYRAWVAATASWLLAGADTTRGMARPARPVVPNGRPLVFQWVGSGRPRLTAVTWNSGSSATTDTLRFDGAGRATAWLPPGEYRYRLSGGGSGTVAVERYSDELLPHPVTLTTRAAGRVAPAGRTSARDWLWLFGLAVVALAVEWFARRRLGLR